MPAHRIHPPAQPDLSAAEIAVLLNPMPVSTTLRNAFQHESDEAMRMANAVGLSLDGSYRAMNDAGASWVISTA